MFNKLVCSKLLFLLCIFNTVTITTSAQTDSLLQKLLQEEVLDSTLLKPSKMLFTQRMIWSETGLLKKRYDKETLIEVRKNDLKIRRTMLQLHQVGGFITLGGMLAQGIIGSQLYKGDYGVRKTHEQVGVGVNIAYGFTAINGLFTPPSSFQRDKKITSIRLHKWLAIAHLSGMIATNILGPQIKNNYELKPYHRAAAYTSFISLAAAMVVIKF